MSERLRQSPEQVSTIQGEKDILKAEADFLKERGKGAYIGVLTNSTINIVSTFYPQIADGMLAIYNYLEKEATNPLSPKGFINRYIANVFMNNARLMTNAEIVALRQQMESGEYTEHFEVYKRFKTMPPAREPSSNRNGRFDDYRTINGSTDVLYNKRACLSRVQGLQGDLRAVYGEVNYQKALLTELVLSAPFFEGLMGGAIIDGEAQQRHQAYIDEAIQFVQRFNVAQRLEAFERETEAYSVKWMPEFGAYDIPQFDKQYVAKVYRLAEALFNGDGRLEDVYAAFTETILRRAQIFKIFTVQGANGKQVQMLPEHAQPLYFDDIAGYDDQKRFLQILLAKAQMKDPTVDDIRIVILAGKPGLGKSLAVTAFLNALPQNAKGVRIAIEPHEGRSGDMTAYDTLLRLASYHPEQHIFGIIEDIDAVAGDRLRFGATGKFLEIGSAVSNSVPSNFHLIATTNRPDVIDPAVTRPGRTAKILIYQSPTVEERKEIVRFHGNRNGYDFSPEILDSIVDQSKGFTPDELRYIFWSLRFEDIEHPTVEDIKKCVEEIRNRHQLEKSTKKAGKGQRNGSVEDNEFEDD